MNSNENLSSEQKSEAGDGPGHSKAFNKLPQSNIGKLILFIILFLQIWGAMQLETKSGCTPYAGLGLMVNLLTGIPANLMVLWFIRWILVKFRILKPRPNSVTYYRLIAAQVIVIALVLFEICKVGFLTF